jgi:hypothetical protein
VRFIQVLSAATLPNKAQRQRVSQRKADTVSLRAKFGQLIDDDSVTLAPPHRRCRRAHDPKGYFFASLQGRGWRADDNITRKRILIAATIPNPAHNSKL